MLSAKNFMVSCLIFKSLRHFELIFVYRQRKCSNFIVLHVAVQLSQHHAIIVFSPFYILASFVKD